MKWSEILPQNALELSATLTARANQERKEGKKICPKQDEIFKALRLTTPDNLKVCIVGQDPYHSPGVANGLAFSVSPNAKIPPSLVNIFHELEQDIGCKYPSNGDLTSWAKQGVLLLNTSLTVYEHQANSHVNWGWQKFTTAIMDTAVKLPQPIVFILWGANAIKLKEHINVKAGVPKDNIILQNLIKKDIIMSSHPSPFSVGKPCGNYPPFKGSKPFSKANELLVSRGVEPIDWELD